MSCRPLRWLWGLIPLALLAAMVNYFARPVVEADLKARGELALKEAGLPWAGMSFEGRDGILSGMAFDEGAREKAIEVVGNTYGVRIVDDRASLVDRVDNFFWLATREEGRIRMKGFVPTEELRKTVIGMASASFPSFEIDDRMKVARGGPSSDAWLSGVNFAFKQLGDMKSGRARLDATKFTIVGEAINVESYSRIDDALNNRLPRGLELASRRITAPKVSPFTWSAVIRGKQLLMRGYVPDADARTKLVSEARSKFPGWQVVDQLTIAGGAPKDWLKSSAVALAALSRMGNGSASMTDANLSISGSTGENTLLGGVQDLLNSELPSSFKRTVDITLVKNANKVTALNWRALLQKSTVILEGDVPDRTMQQRLIAQARQNFPGRRVVNRMNVKSGTPPVGWGIAASRALGIMTRLSEGEATVNGSTVRLSGTARDVSALETIRETVTSYMPAGYEGYEFVKPPAPTYNSYDYNEIEEENNAWWRNYLAGLARKKAEQQVEEKKKVDVKKILASKKPVAANVCASALNEVARTGIVQFETNSARINKASYPTLDRIVSVAGKCPDAAFEISGHTDSDGSAAYNQKLSLRRAQSITAYLSGKGVTGTRMTSAGYGESKPVAPNDTEANKARNRRIEFKILSNGN